jgi:hypothetical protein
MPRLATLVFCLALWPAQALAWGATGHRLVGVAAAQALPAEVPAFLRRPQLAIDLGELSREPDRSKDAGKVHDHDRNPAHFVDVEDDGRILGGPTLDALPPTRAEYEAALRAAGTDQWKAGYLPYAIVDRVQQLAKDLAIWRALSAAERNPPWRAHRAWFAQDRRRREALILATLGDLGHYVGDGSQPLHVTAHYNGWGDYPNPRGYTNAKVHGPFESAFVHDHIRLPMIVARMTPLRAAQEEPLEAQVARYLRETHAQVEPFYVLEKSGAFTGVDPRGAAFASERLAVGASQLRDLIVRAWRMSANAKVGWSPINVSDVEAGRVNPFQSLYGID